MSHRGLVNSAGRTKGACAASVLTLAFTACHQQPLPAPSLQSVRSTYVQATTDDVESRYSAVIAPFAQVDLSFKSPGIVAGIRQVRGADGRIRNIGAGDHIARGADLAHVRAAEYQQSVDQAQAQSNEARAQIADATAFYQSSQTNWIRAQALFQSGSLVKPQYDQAKADFDSAQAKLTSANAALAGADASLAHTRLSLSDTAIHAPFAGWLTARNVEAGMLAGAGTVAFSMVDTHLVKATFAVPDVALPSIHLGSQYEVRLDALPTPVRGTVTAVSQEADTRTHVFTVELTIPNANDAIRAGMICSLRIGSEGSTASRLVVPLSAVTRPPSEMVRFAVFVLEDRDGRTYVRSAPISIGNTYGNSVEVLSGVSLGERIVGIGASLLQSGQQVQVIP